MSYPYAHLANEKFCAQRNAFSSLYNNRGYTTTIVSVYCKMGLRSGAGAKGLGVLHHLPIFRPFFHFHKNPSSSVISGTFSVKTVFRQNPKNARKSQNTPSTNPYQNETHFPLSSLKNATSGHARPPKSVLCPPVISGTNSRQNSLKFP